VLLEGGLRLLPHPAAALDDALLVADLHLGMEEALELEGVHLPYDLSGEVRRAVLGALGELGARRLVIAGDLKHELGAGLRSEYEEVRALVLGARELGAEVVLVRGNHDNFIAPAVERLGGRGVEGPLEGGGCCVVHGHLDVDARALGCGCLVMGHEHPTVTLVDEVGLKHRFKAFLWGEAGGARVLVLPSPNPLAQGTPVNEVGREDLMSPILRRTGVDGFEVYALEPREAVVRLATVGALRALLAEGRRSVSRRRGPVSPCARIPPGGSRPRRRTRSAPTPRRRGRRRCTP